MFANTLSIIVFNRYFNSFHKTEKIMDQYDTAQICLNGHYVNESYHRYPQHNKNYCDKCGEMTVINCQNCGTEIRGYYESNVVIIAFGEEHTPPNYCYNCGKPYPWLDRKMKAAVEMAQLEEVLTEEENNNFSEYVKDITTDTPKSQVSAKKINILLKKFTSSSITIMRSLLVDIASETAKKVIQGN